MLPTNHTPTPAPKRLLAMLAWYLWRQVTSIVMVVSVFQRDIDRLLSPAQCCTAPTALLLCGSMQAPC
jgi:hypothetical protein